MKDEDIWRESDRIFSKAEEIFRDADRLFAKLPEGETVLQKQDGPVTRILHFIKSTWRL